MKRYATVDLATNSVVAAGPLDADLVGLAQETLDDLSVLAGRPDLRGTGRWPVVAEPVLVGPLQRAAHDRYEVDAQARVVREVSRAEDMVGDDLDAAQDEIRQARRADIMNRLAEIDRDSVRPLRAMQAGTATAYDTDKLAALDTEAASLRAELTTLAV